MLDRMLLVLLAVAVAAGGTAGSTRAKNISSGCRKAALVSLATGHVIQRYLTRDEGLVIHAVAPTVLPGEDAVADGHGGWYVAGLGLAHLRGDGQLDPSWHARLHRRFRLGTLARVGNTLYVSDFHRVYALDARSGALRWTSQAVGRHGAGVWALAATRSAVYIGGNFEHVGAAIRKALAALDSRTGRLLAWRVPIRRPFGSSGLAIVSRLALGAPWLYFTGGFDRVGSAARPQGVAAVRLRDGQLTAFRPGARAYEPPGLALWRGYVLLGGREGGGLFDARTGKPRRIAGPLPSASVIAVRGSVAYLGGTYRDQIGGHNLLAVDLPSGELRQWFPHLRPEVIVDSIVPSGDEAFVGGLFCVSI